MKSQVKAELNAFYEKRTVAQVRRMFTERTNDEAFLAIARVAYRSETGLKLDDLNDEEMIKYTWLGYEIAVNAYHLAECWR